ncbi:hypothetical protein T492DRAFT_977298 [Pavlovales sp. CCMP2436]|nr:hypothetical protein T492DRAFT_977298 [Pavlovales sp. CCMP2436]
MMLPSRRAALLFGLGAVVALTLFSAAARSTAVAPTLVVPTAEMGEAMTIVWITDLHLLPFFSPALGKDCKCFSYGPYVCEGKQRKVMPWPMSPSNGSACLAGASGNPWGQFGCDSPIELVRAAIASASKAVPNPTAVLMTGDAVGHRSCQFPVTDPVAEGVRLVTMGSRLMSEGWPSVATTLHPMQPMANPGEAVTVVDTPLGNDDFVPNYYLDPVSDGALGFPLDYLQRVAAGLQMRVIITGHVPPAIGAKEFKMEWIPAYADAFIGLVAAHADTVSLMLFAHTHQNMVLAFPPLAGGKKGPPTLISAAVSPVYMNNPTWRALELDSTGALLNYRVHAANLSATSATVAPVWKPLFDARSRYAPQDVTTSDGIRKFAVELKDNDELFSRYMSDRVSGGGGPQGVVKADAATRAKQSCLISDAFNQTAFDACVTRGGTTAA